MPEYTVFVVPPGDEDAEPFGIPEWGRIEAIATAERYRARGWEARIGARAAGGDHGSFRREGQPCAISSTPR